MQDFVNVEERNVRDSSRGIKDFCEDRETHKIEMVC